MKARNLISTAMLVIALGGVHTYLNAEGTFNTPPESSKNLCHGECGKGAHSTSDGTGCAADSTGEPCVDDCCCYFTRAAGFDKDQTAILRVARDKVTRKSQLARDLMANYDLWGPKAANLITDLGLNGELRLGLLLLSQLGGDDSTNREGSIQGQERPGRLIQTSGERSLLAQQARQWQTGLPPYTRR